MATIADTAAYLKLRAKSKGWSDVVSLAARKFGGRKLLGIVLENARRKYARAEHLPIRAIQIETLGYCNYKCSFCPTNQIDMAKGRMTDELFEKIVGELHDFDGEIRLYLRNEPLLDKRLLRFVQMVKGRTKASILIQTNGSLLTEEIAAKLAPLATIQMNDYSDGEVSERVGAFARKYGIVIADRRSPKGLSNRAGNLPNVKIEKLDAFCTRPFEQVYIAFDGKVVLCCQDWVLEEVMGDISIQSLPEIWEGQVYRRKRAQLLASDRQGLCAKCDHPGI
jgi:MoaA/NifB/PqqE/SkfB family radical SAM enzyme